MHPTRLRLLLAVPLVLYCVSSCSGNAPTGGEAAAVTGGTSAGGRTTSASTTAIAGGTLPMQDTGTTAGSVATGGALAGGGHMAATGGVATGGRAAASGGSGSGGRTVATGGAATGGSGTSAAGSTSICNDASLVWKSANKTNYTSYPDPGSEECIEYNGCTWAGQFAACDGTKPEEWVATHDIVSAFPDFRSLQLHDLCLRKGQKVIVVTVLDTCADSDCSGCCTQNKGSADELIDIESYTDARWGVPDGPIEWADLGPTRGSGCD